MLYVFVDIAFDEGSTNITQHLDHISRCKTHIGRVDGPNWSNRLTDWSNRWTDLRPVPLQLPDPGRQVLAAGAVRLRGHCLRLGLNEHC